MRKLLLATAALVAMSVTGNAAVIQNLGVNPTSQEGDFSNSVGGAQGFTDFYTFQLVGGPQFITIASATNVFPRTTDFITGFAGSVFQQLGGVPDPVTDNRLFGPQTATANCGPFCQGLSGSALLNPGNYYLEITGSGGGTSGYGGNLSTAAVPGPIVGAGLPGLAMALAGWFGVRRRNRKLAAA